MYTTENQIVGEVADWLKKHYSINIHTAERIRRGLMNEKWIFETNKGKFFVKSYHPKRYKMEDSQFREKLENALKLQQLFYQSGGECPEPLIVDRNILHILPCGRYMTAMTCCPGGMAPVGKISKQRMHSLGMAAAKMHVAWDHAEKLGVDVAVPKEAPIWRLSRDELERQWEENWSVGRNSTDRVRKAFLLQKRIIDSVDLDELLQTDSGWTHLDLWADNLLFEGDMLTAIVDFDRVRYSYPILDLGRAILSGTLTEQGFNKDAVYAFAEGYRCVKNLPPGSILNAIKYVWCVESFWWIKPSLESYSVAPARFVKEMLLTGERWGELEGMFGQR